MAQQFDYPKTDIELRMIQDKLYQHGKEAFDAGKRPAWIPKPCAEIIYSTPIRGLSVIFKAHFSTLSHRRYAGCTSTNREKPKSAHWAFPQFGTESYKSA